MNNDYINSIRKSVKQELTKERYQHTLGVSYTAASLAMKYEADMEKAFIAGLLHDCAKCMTDEDKIAECRKHGLKIEPIELSSPYLLHAKLGAFYVAFKYHINDKQIADAILYHTCGKADMTMMEKIIFVSDYIEPYRDKAPRLTELRKTAFENIDRAVFQITKDTLDYLKKGTRPIDEAIYTTYDYYKQFIV